MLKVAIVVVAFASVALAFPADEPTTQPPLTTTTSSPSSLKPFDRAIQECYNEDTNSTYTGTTDPCILQCAVRKTNLVGKDNELDPKKFHAYLLEHEPDSCKISGPYVEQCWRDCRDDATEKCANYRHYFICLRIRPLIPLKPVPVVSVVPVVPVVPNVLPVEIPTTSEPITVGPVTEAPIAPSRR